MKSSQIVLCNVCCLKSVLCGDVRNAGSLITAHDMSAACQKQSTMLTSLLYFMFQEIT